MKANQRQKKKIHFVQRKEQIKTESNDANWLTTATRVCNENRENGGTLINGDYSQENGKIFTSLCFYSSSKRPNKLKHKTIVIARVFDFLYGRARVSINRSLQFNGQWDVDNGNARQLWRQQR